MYKSNLQLQVVLLFILLFIGVSSSSQSNCHFTCLTCESSGYTGCTQCQQGNLIILKDPKTIPPKYKTSHVPTGVCVNNQTNYNDFNVLGFIILIASITLLPLANTNKLFYVISTLQTLSLIGFMEVYWSNIEAYQFHALHYLMPFNIINRMLKTPTLQFKQRQYYNFDLYYINPSILSSLSFVGIINVVIFVLLIVIPIVQILKRRYCGDCCRIVICSEWFLTKLVKVLTTLFFFCIQETMLSLVVALEFQENLSGVTIALTVVYLIMVIFFCIYTFRYKLPYFPNKITQYQTISKKLIFPIFLIVIPTQQFILLIMMIINFILQTVFDRLTKVYPIKNMYTLYRANQIILILFFLVYYFVDIDVNQWVVSDAIGGITVGLLNLMVFWVFLEGGVGIKKRFCSGEPDKQKVSNSGSRKQSTKQQTLQQIQMGRYDTEQNILQAFTKQYSEQKKQEQLQQRQIIELAEDSQEKPRKPEEQKQQKEQIKEEGEVQKQRSSPNRNKKKIDKKRKKELEKAYGIG